MCAAHHRLDNLLAIVDYNKLQSDDTNASIMGLEPLNAKFAAFGWNVLEIDGHDLDAIVCAFESAFEIADKPSIVIAHTVKGKGVSFMERVPQWHGSVKLTREQAEDALKALGCGTKDVARWLDVGN
jgi:transketolase